jgi:hypothetical protein
MTRSHVYASASKCAPKAVRRMAVNGPTELSSRLPGRAVEPERSAVERLLFLSVHPIWRLPTRVTALPFVIPSEAEGSAVSLSLAKAGCPICPDFLRRLVASIHFMRLSLLKGAHADLSSTAWQEIGVKPCFGLEWDTTALDAFFVIRRRRLARERETTCPWQITGEIDTAKLPWMQGPEGRPPKRQPSPEGLGINPKTI